jgi:hypothetical protein
MIEMRSFTCTNPKCARSFTETPTFRDKMVGADAAQGPWCGQKQLVPSSEARTK